MGLMAIAGFTLAFAAGLTRSGPRTGILLAVATFGAIGRLSANPVFNGIASLYEAFTAEESSLMLALMNSTAR